MAIWDLDFFNTPEDEISFSTFTKFSFLVYRFALFEFKPLKKKANFKEKFIHFLKSTYFKLCLVSQCWAFVSFVIIMIINAENVVDFARNFANTMTGFLVTQKALSTYAYKDDLWKIFQEIQPMFERRAGDNKKYGIKKYLDGYNLLVKFYSASAVLVFIPIVLPPFRYLMFGTMKLSLDFYYPFEPYQPVNFFYASFWFAYICYNSLIFMFSFDSLLYGLITIISMEFDILKVDILNIKTLKGHEQTETVNNLVDRHNRVLDLTSKLQNIYAVTFTSSFFVSSLILCFVVFQLSTARKFATFLMYVPYLGLIGGQVLLLCMFGQKMIDSSEMLVDGINKCGWEEFEDNTLRKHIILMILRAQKIKRFSALGFADISLESFTSVSPSMLLRGRIITCHYSLLQIITTTGSYFSLLKNFSTEDPGY